MIRGTLFNQAEGDVLLLCMQVSQTKAFN